MTALLVCLVAVFLLGLPATCTQKSTKPAEPAAIVRYIVRNVLSTAGVKSPEQIESVIIWYPTRCTYKITRKDSPALVNKIYESLQPMRPAEHAADYIFNGSMTFILAGGKAFSLKFYYEPMIVPQTVFVSPRYHAPKLLEMLKEIQKNATAAELDARVGQFEVDSFEVKHPRGDYGPILPASAKEGQVLIPKAKALVDWLDLRNARANTIPDIDSAMAKFGGLSLFLKTPTRLTIEVWDEATAPKTEPDPIGTNIRFDTFLCDKIVVLDYGNYIPPLLALRNMNRPYNYYLCPRLTRRAQEKYGVEKLGFPGHPISDTEYYTPPEQLYKSLQEYIGELQ